MNTETSGGDLPQAITISDGDPCDRVAVRVRRARTANFGQVAGFAGATTDVHSVALATQSPTGGAFAGLVGLESTGCDVIETENSLSLRVEGPAPEGGVLWVDSDASTCGAGQYVVAPASPARVDVLGPGATPGVLQSWATTAGRGIFVSDPARVTPAPAAAPRRLGREAFDDRYNCGDLSCAPQPAHIDQLRAFLGAPAPPATFVLFPDCSGVVVPLPGVDYYVTCPSITASLTFTGDVLFEGPVTVQAGGCLAVNSNRCGGIVPTPRDAIAYVRGGDFTKDPSGILHMERTFLHLTGTAPAASGRFVADRGNGVLTWTAPFGGPFEDLLLWAEADGVHALGEQDTGWELDGAVFVPNGTVDVRALQPTFVLEAQIVARRFVGRGNGILVLAARPDRAALTPIRAVRLIR
jgi:hypothetical protein